MFKYRGVTGNHIGEGVWTFKLNGRRQYCTSLQFCMYMIDNRGAYK